VPSFHGNTNNPHNDDNDDNDDDDDDDGAVPAESMGHHSIERIKQDHPQ
jgi:hypothetical protein